MGISNIDLIQNADQDVNQLQINIKKCLAQFVNNLLLDSNVVTVTLAVGDNQIPHGLNRAFLGQLVYQQSAVSSFYNNQGTVDPTKILVLNSSAACTVSLYIF